MPENTYTWLQMNSNYVYLDKMNILATHRHTYVHNLPHKITNFKTHTRNTFRAAHTQDSFSPILLVYDVHVYLDDVEFFAL